jgi:hypothetical protein
MFIGHLLGVVGAAAGWELGEGARSQERETRTLFSNRRPPPRPLANLASRPSSAVLSLVDRREVV